MSLRRTVVMKDPEWKLKAAKARKKRISEKRRTQPKSKTQMRNLCDKLFSQVIRSAGICAVQDRGPHEERYGPGDDDVIEYARCLKDRGLQCAHIMPRSYFAVRWDERNAVCLCQACHVYYTHHPLEWQEWIEGHIGLKNYLILRQLALSHIKPDYQETAARLQRRLLEIKR